MKRQTCSSSGQSLAARSASYALSAVLGAQGTESVLVLADEGAYAVGQLFFDAACQLSQNVAFVTFPPLSAEYPEPPKPVAGALGCCDVYVAITSKSSKSITHTVARRKASAAGARGLTLPGITEELLARPAIRADYNAIAKATEALARRLNGVRQLRLLSDAGTDIVFDVHGGVWFPERGLCRERGQFSNLPGGEVSIVPVEAEGTLVIDASFSGLGKLHSPLILKVEGQHVVAIEGEQSEELRATLSAFGPCAFNVAEIGIGMNPEARVCGHVLEDEKVLGTVHVGLGDNANMGGKTLGKIVSCGIHVDGVIAAHPQLFADGELVIPERFFDITKGGLHE